jgi:hypothetical protein
MLAGQRADGSTNHARNETRPSHGEALTSVADWLSARPKAVSQIRPTVR